MSRKIIKLLALTCALVMALSGCNLIRIDEDMDAAEVVASFDGGVVTKGEVLPEYESTVEYYEYLSYYYGYSFSTDGVLESVVNNLVERKILLAKAAELGLDALTEEEEAEVIATAEGEFEDTLMTYWDNFAAEGLSDEQIRADVEAYLAENEYTPELIAEARREDKIIEKLQQTVFETVVISPEDVKAEYDAMVAADQASYADLYVFESAVTSGGVTVAWYPEGYRTVKHILLSFTDEQMAELANIDSQIADLEDQIAALEGGEAPAQEGDEIVLTADQLQMQIDALETTKEEKMAEYIAVLQPTIDEIYGRIEAGDDFQTLIDEYNEDQGMESIEGYYVCADSQTWVPAFRDGAMALENIGDVSEPVATNYGVHIIRYHSDVTAGAVPFEQIEDVAEANATADKHSAAFAEQAAAWVEEANVVIDLSVIEE